MSDLDKLQPILNTAIDAVVVADARGLIVDWSPRAEAMFGWTRAEVLGRSLADLIVPSPLRQAHQQGLERFVATRVNHVLDRILELSALRRSGEEFPAELSVTCWGSDEDPLFLGFIRDISERRETVAKLAAGILDNLEGQSTKFDLQLDPPGLGKVDVSVEIASDGKLTAQLGFDSQLGLTELRGRAQELRAALEQAGFTLTDNALNFDFSGERRQQQAGDTRDSNSDQAGKAFARAMGSLDEELAAAPTRYQARRGLDLLI